MDKSKDYSTHQTPHGPGAGEAVPAWMGGWKGRWWWRAGPHSTPSAQPAAAGGPFLPAPPPGGPPWRAVECDQAGGHPEGDVAKREGGHMRRWKVNTSQLSF